MLNLFKYNCLEDEHPLTSLKFFFKLIWRIIVFPLQLNTYIYVHIFFAMKVRIMKNVLNSVSRRS